MDQTHSLENLDISGEKKNGINENNFQNNISPSKKIKIIIVISIIILVLGIAGLIAFLILSRKKKPSHPIIPVPDPTPSDNIIKPNTTLPEEISVPIESILPNTEENSDIEDTSLLSSEYASKTLEIIPSNTEESSEIDVDYSSDSLTTAPSLRDINTDMNSYILKTIHTTLEKPSYIFNSDTTDIPSSNEITSDTYSSNSATPTFDNEISTISKNTHSSTDIISDMNSHIPKSLPPNSKEPSDNFDSYKSDITSSSNLIMNSEILKTIPSISEETSHKLSPNMTDIHSLSDIISDTNSEISKSIPSTLGEESNVIGSNMAYIHSSSDIISDNNSDILKSDNSNFGHLGHAIESQLAENVSDSVENPKNLICEEGEEDKCLTCEKNRCIMCNAGYELINGTCEAIYTIKAIYSISEEGESFGVINYYFFYGFVSGMILDGERIEYYNYAIQFPSKGNHTIYFITYDKSITDLSYLFYNIQNLISVSFSNKIKKEKLITVNSMFSECKSLVSVDISQLNTKNVTDMSYMFYGCNSLISLDISKLNTKNVADMSYMFYGCNSLTSLDISQLNKKCN